MLNYRLNFFLFLRTIWGTLRHTDWDRAYARAGVWGTLCAFCAGLIGFNAWPFFVRAGQNWTPEQITELLQTRGIAAWGWGYHSGEFFFRVRLHQAHWAQYLLLTQGVPLTGQLLASDARHGAVAGRAYTLDNGAQESTRGSDSTRPRPPVMRDPVGALNRVVDRLAGF